MALNDKQAVLTLSAVSLAAFGFLIWLNYFSAPGGVQPAWASGLPHLNALLNASTTVLMCLGVWNIKQGRRETHQKLMLAALACSGLFLVSYITYHHLHGDSKFLGQGWIRPVYFFILISHILTSALALPLLVITAYFALTGRFDRHPRIARWTFPVWLYVSVTGVVVYLFLRPYY